MKLIDKFLKKLYSYHKNLKNEKIYKSDIVEKIPELIKELKMSLLRLMFAEINAAEEKYNDKIEPCIKNIETSKISSITTMGKLIDKQKSKLKKFRKVLENCGVYFYRENKLENINFKYEKLEKRLEILERKIEAADKKIIDKIINTAPDESASDTSLEEYEEENKINIEIEEISKQYKNTEDFETLYKQYIKINEYIVKLKNKTIKITEKIAKLGEIKNEIKTKLKGILNKYLLKEFYEIKSEMSEITEQNMSKNKQDFKQKIPNLNKQLTSIKTKIKELNQKYGDFIKKDLNLNLDDILKNIKNIENSFDILTNI